MRALLDPEIEEQLPEEPAAEIGKRLEALEREAAPGSPAATIAAAALETYRSMLSEVGFVPLLRDVLLEHVRELEALAPPAVKEAASDSLERVDRPKSSEADARGRSMRVDEAKIDEFLDYVGELIVVREMFHNVGKRLREEGQQGRSLTEYQQAMAAFMELSRDLQNSIMEVRKVSVATILNKVPRIVRDLAHQTGKVVNVTVHGDHIAIDKSLLEGMEGTLVHMLRNAIDHGIELPDERQSAGKPRMGSLGITVTETPDEIVFQIADDGSGIDGAALRDKAVANGLLTATAAASLDDAASYALLVLPGVSTAKVVTDISGRGVGMDAVVRNVEDLGGRVDISSVRGRGATFSVRLPKRVTVQILDGFIVRVSNE